MQTNASHFYSERRGKRPIIAFGTLGTGLAHVANCWEALGEYGGWLGRYDLVQEGYYLHSSSGILSLNAVIFQLAAFRVGRSVSLTWSAEGTE